MFRTSQCPSSGGPYCTCSIYTHAHPTKNIDIRVLHLLDVTVGKNGDMFLIVSLPIFLLWARDIGVFTDT
jgi:hypothetical protein